MRKFVRLATSLVALSALVFFTSCEKQSVSKSQSEISFSINNLTNSLAKKESKDADLPDCVDGVAHHVVVNISGTDYTLKVLENLEDGNQTEVIKLDAGTYTINSFMVYTQDNTPLYAAPITGSYYQNLWGLTGVALDFDTEKFQKKKVSIDVLCYRPYDYKNFGFNWFEFSKIEIKTLCFFGDICIYEHELWHSVGSYYNQSNYEGFDFPAIMRVIIRDAGGNQVNDENLDDNMFYPDGSLWQGVGDPLCIEYPDFIGQVDSYTIELYVIIPNGDEVLLATIPFNAEDDFTEVDENGDPVYPIFGPNVTEDGIFDFAVGPLCDGYMPPRIFRSTPPPPPGEEPQPGCETAFAKFPNTDDPETGYVFTSKPADNPEHYPSISVNPERWGWAGMISQDITVPIWAAAGKNDTTKGYLVGNAVISFNGDDITVDVDLDTGYTMSTIHIFIEDSMPTTFAPGQYTIDGASGVLAVGGDGSEFMDTYTVDDAADDGLWVIIHAEVCGDDGN